MGIITISMKDEVEQKLRVKVKEMYGTKKGALKQAVEDAIKTWLQEKKQKEVADRQRTLMKKGFHMGTWKFTREELYDR